MKITKKTFEFLRLFVRHSPHPLPLPVGGEGGGEGGTLTSIQNNISLIQFYQNSTIQKDSQKGMLENGLSLPPNLR